jgi:excisionase family DNA binding protein
MPESRPAPGILDGGLTDVNGACEFLHLSKSMVYRLMDEKLLPFVRIGRARRLPKRALIEFAEKNLSAR